MSRAPLPSREAVAREARGRIGTTARRVRVLYVEGREVAEIAETLAMPVRFVERALHRTPTFYAKPCTRRPR